MDFGEVDRRFAELRRLFVDGDLSGSEGCDEVRLLARRELIRCGVEVPEAGGP